MSAKPKNPKSFEEAMVRLETLTSAMQSSELPLEEAMAAYEEGRKLVAFCQEKLALVEAQLKVVEEGQEKDLMP